LEKQVAFAKQGINLTEQSERGAGFVPGHDLYSVIPDLKPVTPLLKCVTLLAMITFGTENRNVCNQFSAGAKKPFVRSGILGN
jgi:hypothetical protein